MKTYIYNEQKGQLYRNIDTYTDNFTFIQTLNYKFITID